MSIVFIFIFSGFFPPTCLLAIFFQNLLLIIFPKNPPDLVNRFSGKSASFLSSSFSAARPLVAPHHVTSLSSSLPHRNPYPPLSNILVMRKSFSNLNAPSLSDQLPSAVFSDSPAPCTPSLHQVTIPVFPVSPLAEKVLNSSVGLNSSSYAASRSSKFKASCDVVDPPVQPDLIVKEISLKPIKTSRCCSNCGQSGHCITTCPVAKEEQLKLQSDSFSLNSSLDLDSFDTPNSEDLDSADLLLASVSDLKEKPATKNSSSCPFVIKL
ncbi:hypothetical protein GEMRC1_002581 [Eukaryota sp. GEM-RC1]